MEYGCQPTDEPCEINFLHNTIVHCKLHAAASELLDACQKVQEWLLDKGPLIDDGISHPLFIKANNAVAAAITQATSK